MNRTNLIFIFILINLTSFATTWNEPWQKEIIEKSEYFALGKVIKVSDTSVTVHIIKNFGPNLKEDIIIDGFFMLQICSQTGGHRPEFYLKEGDEGYFLMKKGENGNYQIPTPTSGFDRIVDGTVYATYRHTYHRATIKPEVYEMTYKEIWKKYHSRSFNKKEIKKFIDHNLSLKPAGFSDDEIDLFFLQHVALETAYLLEIEIDFEILKKFIEIDNFHSKISALRVMGLLNTNVTKQYLFDYIKNSNNDNFTIVMAIYSLLKLEDDTYLNKLFSIKNELSDKETGFGGNIMDPRICTRLPNPKNLVISIEKSINNNKTKTQNSKPSNP